MKSDTHKNLQEIIGDHYRTKGWIAITEQCINGKKIDVLAQDIKTKRIIANEVQLASKHFIENILLDFKAGCNEVRIISANKTVLEEMKQKASKKLDKNLLGKIKFQLIEEFIPYSNNRNNTK